ncbi:MAG: BlaI/MecI/CopY family transcriptional regulator [Eubacteriales bacterium]|jgi:BlaI family penicillinase repressor
MATQHTDLTPAEWNVMECLWAHAPRTGREAVEDLAQRAGWSRSTTLTMLRRMTQKGLLRCEEIQGCNAYFPLISREEAVQQETKDFLSRVYQGSISLMMSSMVQKQALSKEEMDQLYNILQQAEEANQHD